MKLIGIDPGWKNLGAATSNGSTLSTQVFNPSSYPTLAEAVGAILTFVSPQKGDLATLERYVAYEGVHNPDSEYILMVTGALVVALQNAGVSVRMVRAIEWKPALCKRLYKAVGFKNPSTKFDKVYSMAACRAVFPEVEVKTDHEADAACLCSLRQPELAVQSSDPSK